MMDSASDGEEGGGGRGFFGFHEDKSLATEFCNVELRCGA
jgi:hypothetical protein